MFLWQNAPAVRPISSCEVLVSNPRRIPVSGVVPAFLIGIYLFAACAPSVCFAAAPQESAHNDNQVWFDGQFAYPAAPRIEILGFGGARLGRDAGHATLERGGVGVSYWAWRFLSLAPAYNYIIARPFAGKDTREHRFSVDGTLSWKLLGFYMSDRNRWERRMLPAGAYSRYRNRMQIQHPLSRPNLTVSLADEVFYDGALAIWSRNRFFIGISKRVSGTLAIDFYYMRQNDHYSHCFHCKPSLRTVAVVAPPLSIYTRDRRAGCIVQPPPAQVRPQQTATNMMSTTSMSPS